MIHRHPSMRVRAQLDAAACRLLQPQMGTAADAAEVGAVAGAAGRPLGQEACPPRLMVEADRQRVAAQGADGGAVQAVGGDLLAGSTGG